MSKVIEHKNGYGDTIVFTMDDSTGTVIMTGDEYTRAGFNQLPTYTWIDPSGGPFISVSDNLAEIIDVEFGEFIVQEITNDGKSWILSSPHSATKKKINNYMNQVESIDYNPHGKEETSHGNRQKSSNESPQSGEEGI